MRRVTCELRSRKVEGGWGEKQARAVFLAGEYSEGGKGERRDAAALCGVMREMEKKGVVKFYCVLGMNVPLAFFKQLHKRLKLFFNAFWMSIFCFF